MSRELKLIEKRQVQRLNTTVSATNHIGQTRTNATPATEPVPESALTLKTASATNPRNGWI